MDLLVRQEAQGLRHARGGVLWCSADGGFRIPVAFRLWRPKRSCTPGAYQTKLQLAAQMLTELVATRLPFSYLVMDTHYTAGWFTRLAGRLGICWVGTLPPKTTVIWRGRRQSAAELAERLRLAWRPRLGLRAAAVTVYAPKYGTATWSRWSPATWAPT
jgi:DDE superfamily endonuclease